jgi:hypothetical protein
VKVNKYEDVKIGDLLFHSGKGPISTIIQTVTQSKWSHVELVSGKQDGRLLTISAEWHGLNIMIRNPESPNVEIQTLVGIETKQRQGALEFAFDQAYKRADYDYWGVIGYGVSYIFGYSINRWQKRTAWFCSEICYQAHVEGGYFGGSTKAANVSPARLYELCSGSRR